MRKSVLSYLFSGFVVLIVSAANSQPPLLAYKGEAGEIIHGLGYLRDTKVSPNGDYLAAGGSLGIFLWDLNGELSKPVTFFPRTDVREIIWEKNSNFILLIYSGSSSGILQDIRKGIPFGTDHDHRDIVLDGTYQFAQWEPYRENLLTTPDGSRSITVELDHIAVWDNASHSKIHEIPGQYREDLVSFMNVGEAITAVSGATAFVWDANTVEQIRTVSLAPEGYGIYNSPRSYTIQFTPMGSYIVATSWKPSSLIIQVTDINTGEGRVIDAYTEGSIFAFSNDRQKAFIVEESKTLLLDLETWQYTLEFNNPDSHSSHDTLGNPSAVFSPDDSIIAYHPSELRKLDINFYDTKTGKLVNTLETEKLSTSLFNDVRLQYSPNGQMIIAVQNKGADVFDVPSGAKIIHFKYPIEENNLPNFNIVADSYVPSRDFRFITLAVNNHIDRWDMINQIRICVLEPVLVRGSRPALSPNGLVYIRYERSREEFHYDLSQCREIRTTPEVTVSNLDYYQFSPDEEWLLGFKDDECFWYHVPTNRFLKRISSTSFNGGIASISISQDLEHVYIGRFDGTIVEFNLPEQSSIEDWKKHN